MLWPWNGRGRAAVSAVPLPVTLEEDESLRLREALKGRDVQIAALRKHLDSLHTFAKKLGKIKDLREVYRFVADVCIEVFEFDRANILIANEKTGLLECVETRGNKDEPIEAIRVPISPESGALYHAYIEGKIITLDVGTKEDPRPIPEKYMLRKPWSDIKAFRSHSCMIGALHGREKPVGVFGIDRKFRKLRITQDDNGLVKILRDIASYSIQNLQAMEELKVHQEEIYGLIRGALGQATEGREKATRMAQVNKDLLESSQKIEGITKTIVAIAAQTNLLSVNAAIEAAKAGTQGLSFGVVAAEVKRRAGQTRGASGEIESIIRRITTEIDASRATMDEVAAAQQSLIQSIEVLHAKAENLV